MSGSLTLALRTAQSGLLTSQSALDAVAQNVANVNSPGYSRKIVHMEQRVVAGVGAGVELSEVVRAVDEGLLESLRESISTAGQHDSQNSYYARMQDLFGAPGDNISIAHTITEFGNAIEALALSPDQSLEATEFVRQGAEVADKLQDMSDTLQELREQADSEIANRVASINSIAENLVNLNNSIIENDTAGADVTDLRDKRDTLLNDLAEYIDIKYFYRSDGDVVVFTQNGKTLVDNSAVSVTHTAASNVAPTTTHAEGDFSGIYIGSQLVANDITNELRDGELKGLVDLRDGVLADLQSQLDEFAGEMRDAINLYHNRGSTYPGLTTMNGTRAFLNSATQTITMGNNSDTRLTVFDSAGDQYATTTIQTIMASATYGTGAQAANGPWDIDEVALSMQGWLQANGTSSATVAVDATTKKLNLELNSTTYYVSMRDEVNSAGTVPAPTGSTASDATIQFDANADGTIDETVSGFSNFFGLNDFFVDDLADNIHETNIQNTTFTATAGTITLYTGAASTNIAVTSGQNLGNIADSINNASAGFTATVIPDGSGERLRITSDDGSNFAVTQAAGDSILTDIGMHSADVRVTQNIKVRTDLEATPGNVTRSQMQWDSTKGFAGEYYISKGDGSIIKDMATMFQTGNAFDAAGGLSSTTVTFSVRATSILSYNSSLADRNDFNMEYHESLKDSLKLKTDSFSGVNLDEEMSQLILYEQSYSAAARVISVIQSMFDSLDRVIS
ncbi:flagellar hook-associated protein FlgK [Magnetovibrio sp. PR-2]|uniref:flagellar hook-associated protein FlgK n=1 Tax=Magnetovibrio sp. PR-2 TaxID=3120356 RepID=UPI002FCE4D9B